MAIDVHDKTDLARLWKALSRSRETMDLFDTFRAIREKAFGRIRSGMKPIPGL